MMPRLATRGLGFILMMGFVGCSFFTPRAPEDVRFMRADLELDVSADEIKDNLEKHRSNAGGFYEVYIMPLTPAYLQARQKEMARLRGLDEKERQKLAESETQRYLEGKNCFHLAIQITRHREALSLQDWSASVTDREGRFYELDWTHFGPVIEGRYQTTHGEVPQWSLSAEVCSRDKIQWERGFDLILTPNFTPWPFPRSFNFQWTFEGTKKERKEKRKSYKRYRGY